jgi:hypothetical protein
VGLFGFGGRKTISRKGAKNRKRKDAKRTFKIAPIPNGWSQSPSLCAFPLSVLCAFARNFVLTALKFARRSATNSR